MAGLASLFLDKNNNPKQQVTIEKTVYTVLFVDDEINVIRAMRRIFKRENYSILSALSGVDALEILRQNPVQVVISDHQMPGMTGAELLRKIKSLYPRTIRIMLTGHADVGAIMGAVNDGAVYKFITKPWNDDDLRLTVSLALEQYDLIKENRSLKDQQKVQKKEIKQLRRLVDVHRSQIGHILLKKKIITEENLHKALAVQKKKKTLLPILLSEMGIVDEKTIIKTLQSDQGINRVYPNEFTVPKALTALIPKEICFNNMLVPLKKTGARLIVAMVDPTDFMKLDDLKFITGITIHPAIATQKEITEKIQELYGENETLESVLSEMGSADPSEDIEIIVDEEDEDLNVKDLLRAKDQPPAIRLVNAIISDALRHNASDVHIEPKTKHVMVRYRIDGLLQEKMRIPLSMHMALVSRIKVMCELDITERRKPQDGRVAVKTSSRMVDMRISTLPTINGEKVVLRILDKSATIKDVTQLGLSDADLLKLSRVIAQPQGMILVTGPTGSGKTSTLYSLLQKSATPTKNYVTIEDPVEYFMSMAGQVNIRRKIGLDFPTVLRTILRQDPNVIMLGEIRDYETAEVALHAALTGHVVFSTLHTNGTVASVTRLRDMGVKSYVISEALICIVAQRLVRRICRHCGINDDPSEKLLRSLKLTREGLDFRPQKGAGCSRCNQTGYNGRVAVFEVFQVGGESKKMIHRNATETEIMEELRRSGMPTLFEDALSKVRSGLTTLEEVLRVLGAQDSSEFNCPRCNVDLEEPSIFCPFCGESLTPRCKGCGKLLRPDWKCCPDCGEKLSVQGELP